MNVDAIKSTVKQLPSKAHDVIDYIGTFSIDSAITAKHYLKDNVKINIPKNDTFESLSKNAEGIKQTIKSSGIYEFIKNHKETVAGSAVVLAATNFIKNNKTMIAGSAVVLAALYGVSKIIKAITNKNSD